MQTPVGWATEPEAVKPPPRMLKESLKFRKPAKTPESSTQRFASRPLAAPTDEALMADYVAGNTAAFRQLFERHGPLIFSAMRRRGLSEADAHDLVQHTFLLAHQSRKDFKPGLLVTPWLWTIAFNAMRTNYRSLMRSQARSKTWGEAQAFSHDTQLPHEEQHSVQGAISKLRPAHQEVVVLHWYEGLSFPEIAKVLAASESAVKVRAHRAYQCLRALLTDPLEPSPSTRSAGQKTGRQE